MLFLRPYSGLPMTNTTNGLHWRAGIFQRGRQPHRWGANLLFPKTAWEWKKLECRRCTSLGPLDLLLVWKRSYIWIVLPWNYWGADHIFYSEHHIWWLIEPKCYFLICLISQILPPFRKLFPTVFFNDHTLGLPKTAGALLKHSRLSLTVL